ncbi:MAG: universal stress protein [Gallionellales bacterium RIFCSPLOWO2_02_FULL_57_47]|nr:MAG: universal stress protein [Gallionellales bacterium RIFCSPLOWO2_02_FULL_57_47]OGT13559.1 MAG: universal stress protein [Gallionellales bacterium RIFCSPHIGHO2_02_FULL_57_16]
MYQRILVPIDGSETSGRALQEAIKIADGKAQLRLVYVIEEGYALDAEGYAFIDYGALQEAFRQTGERALAQAAKTVQRAGLAAETAVLDVPGEHTANVIDNDALSWKADLIVIGTHGRSGIGRLLLGSVAEHVARGASVPVLLVRGG